jgi:hypothetical protein
MVLEKIKTISTVRKLLHLAIWPPQSFDQFHSINHEAGIRPLRQTRALNYALPHCFAVLYVVTQC